MKSPKTEPFRTAEYTTVARISKTFGAEGGLLLNLFDTFPEDFDPSEPLFVHIDGLAVPLFCARFERRGRSGALAVFDDMENVRRSRELVGKELALLTETEATDENVCGEGEIFLEDMVGLRAVLNETREGRIEAFIDGENPLFRIVTARGEVLVPAVEEFLSETDMENGIIRFDLPDGLLELYEA